MTKKSVIFVDDDPNVLQGLRRMLHKQRSEWDMEFVTSGPEALCRMAESRFDVIVADLRMPDMSGAELLEQVLRRHPDVARIVLSGSAGGVNTTRALQVAHQYLSKPTDPETLKVAVARACPLERIVRNERIRAAVAACDTLPSMPVLCAEIVQAAESEAADARRIASIISRDMGMSAKILQLVNSSFFGIGRRVSSIEHTVALLGVIRIKALVLTDHIFKAFVSPRRINGFCIEQLWRHSLMVAEVAGLISKEEEQGGDRPDQAFTAGLLHDVGILILACQHTDEFEKALLSAQDNQRPVHEVEMAVLQVTHAEIGAYLLGLWGLPKRLVEAIALHHTPNEIDYDGLCALSAVHVANVLVAEISGSGPCYVPDSSTSELDMDYLERIGLADRLERWRELAMNACDRTMELHG